MSNNITLAAATLAVNSGYKNITINNSYVGPKFAGSYYLLEAESTILGAITIGNSTPSTSSITECGANSPDWRVKAYLKRNLNTNIYVKRVDSGNSNMIYGGDSYLPLSEMPVTFFCGDGDVTNVAIQYKLSPLDIRDGHGDVTWQVNYIVEEL